ncbi:MAG: translocation/assembly module TamB domain-containing protein [Novosphingobium sp.]
MAEDAPPEAETPPPAKPVRRGWSWRKYLLAAVLALFGVVTVGVLVLNSPIGHRFVVERIMRYAPASGLRISIGRIDGSLYGKAKLKDVVLSDPRGPFLRVPDVDLDWRPFNWFTRGLDVRKIVLHRGTLLRQWKLNPGRPDAPILPNFDIRIDHLEIDRLTVSEGIMGERRRIDLIAKADIRKGWAMIRTNARLGGGDRFAALLDAEPDRDKFDMQLDYVAPKGGLLATLAGAQRDLRARIVGKGTWSDWRGALLVDSPGAPLAALRLTNRSGRYGILGLVWPQDMLTGVAAKAAGPAVAIDAEGTLVNSVLEGRFLGIASGAQVDARGKVDLGNNVFDGLVVKAGLRDPRLIEGTRIERAGLSLELDGAFTDLIARHALVAERIVSGTLRADRVSQTGVATRQGSVWTLPLDLKAARIVTGNAAVDPRLVNARLTGRLQLAGSRLSGDNLAVAVPGLAARLTLRGDVAQGGYALAGPVAARGWKLENLGTIDAHAKILLKFGQGIPWRLAANLAGSMPRVDNPTLTTIAGSGIKFSGAIRMGSDIPLIFDKASLTASKLSLNVSGRLTGNTTTLSGGGRHVDYGPFTVEASIAGDGPRAVLVFASPLPAAGLKDVRVALAPIQGGFRIETSGGSTLGPFSGTLGLFSPPGGPTRLQIERLEIWKTNVTGALLVENGGVNGTLKLAGGGVDGLITLEPRSGGQGFKVALTAENARFGGENPLTISSGRLEAQGLIAKGHTTVTGNLLGQGIGRGNLFLGRIAARASVTDGRGRVTASIAGRRGSRFALQVLGEFAPNRIAVLANGEFAGSKITMPRRAVLSGEDGGWRLAPTQVDYAGGRLIASGLFGSTQTELRLALADMPLSLADILVSEIGLGGKASGVVEYRQPRGGVPTGSVSLMIKGLTRSGLVLTSRPVDLALVANLGANALETRAVAREGGQVRGRLQARISNLPGGGTLADRLFAGTLFGQLRYNGPADALWRLAAIDAFDLTGPVSVAADMTGTLGNPLLRGSLASTGMRLQSQMIGTDVSQISLQGSFAGSRLTLSQFSGRTAGGGTVAGSGTVDLTDLSTKGPVIDLKLAAHNARLLNRVEMGAAVTGPLRIVSDGLSGTIAGRVSIDTANWQLGRASAAAQLPNVPTREINAPADIAPRRTRGLPWKFLIDAAGPNRIAVRGMGLDSEWGARIRLRGTTDAMRIFGQADMIRGSYEFAGTRFDLIRGRINFDGESPPNPRLDIVAEAQLTGLTARVTVSGSGNKPEINFSSTPSLPEDELLARLLFGSSISQISAPEALQLGAALASLRGGGGLDPINKLRSAIGLDRLRIIPADPVLNRGTGIAAGKYFGRRFYAEIITDGRGYNATSVEFRVTSWLSVLGSVSTIGRQSANVKVSKDY